MEKMKDGKTLYLCDCVKNEKCGKKSCGYLSRGKCYCTSDPKYARKLDGKPLPMTECFGMVRENEIEDCIRRMIGIRDVGIVNAREDTKTIADAVEYLCKLYRILAWMDFKYDKEDERLALIMTCVKTTRRTEDKRRIKAAR